jgi:hypothetical protein
MRLLIAVCCVVVWGGVACAEEKHSDTLGFGFSSCAKYAELYRMRPDEIDNMYLAWAQGYISGVNSQLTTTYYDLGPIDIDEMKRFLRQFCNDHPLADYKEGVKQLMRSLPHVKREV